MHTSCPPPSGSWDVLAAAVDDMYLRLLSDPSTAPFFAGYERSVLAKHMVIILAIIIVP